MDLTTMHYTVRSAIRGDSECPAISGAEGEALAAWKTRWENTKDLAMASAKEWFGAPAPMILAK